LSLRQRVDEEVRLQARGQADVVAATAADVLAPSQRAQLRALAGTAARSVRGRVVVTDRSGVLVADSAGPAELGTSYAQRPEVAAALSGRSVQTTRRSQTLGEELLATATPVFRGGRTAGAVRVTQSVAALHRAVRTSIGGLVLIAGVVLLMGLAAGWLIARQLARPLLRLEATAGRIAHGDLDRRAPIEGTTEQRSLARSFNEMTDRLARALRGQREFVADASHQLRTPLTGLKLRLEEAQAAGAATPDPAVQDEVRAALAEVDRLSHVVDELLLLSRAEERDAPAEELELGRMAGAAAERWEKAAAARGITIDVTRDGATTIRCARPDLDRALDSLLENAIQYSPERSSIRIAAAGRAIEVIDDGPGLAPDELEEVFERFHRGRAGRAVPAGTGLGLPIARELMRRWNAETVIENRPDGGAQARIRFRNERSD
jgi:signal transduction histidine kinase